MFHSGDLNSGITLAIQQQKLVVCFIHMPAALASLQWEKEYLARPYCSDKQCAPLGDLIAEKVVLLKIELGSKEAGFLEAFCSIEKAPTLVVIHNGQVLEKIEDGVEEQEFAERILKAVGLYESVHAADEEDDDENPGDTNSVNPSAQRPVSSEKTSAPTTVDPSSAIQETPTQQQQSQPPPTDLSTLFPSRIAQQHTQHAQSRAAESAALKARQEARRQEAENANKNNKGKQPAASEQVEKQKSRDAWINQQKQRINETKKERERILAQIEADKVERRARAEETKAIRNGESGEGGQSSNTMSDARVAGMKRSAGAGGMCSLQIRLFNGLSLRGRFPTHATLDGEVRSWIRENQPSDAAAVAGDGHGDTADVPYTFRHLLAPQPARSIEMGEERQTLGELGLAPTATLVLVPVAGYTDAYSSSPSSGVLGWGLSLAASAYNLLPDVSYFLPSFSRHYLGLQQAPAPAAEERRSALHDVGGMDGGEAADEELKSAGTALPPGKIRMQTFADQRAEAARKDRGTEFYNGNSLGFEGRRDDEDDGKGGRR